MNAITDRGPILRIWIVWAVLVAATLVAWTDAEAGRTTIAALVVLGLATAKIALVMGVYMEVAAAPDWVRIAALAWLVVVALVLTVLLGLPDLARELLPPA